MSFFPKRDLGIFREGLKTLADESSVPDVQLLIIAKNVADLAPSVKFLARRGIVAVVLTSVKEGMEYIGNHQPKCAMLSINLLGTNPGKIIQALTRV